MLSRLGERAAARPRRSFLLLLAVLLVSAVLGAPTAGVLDAEGGFQPPNSGSEQATERIEAATGAQDGPGVVALVQTPDGADAPAAQARITELEKALAARPGIDSTVSSVSTGADGFVTEDGKQTFIAATLKADAVDADVAADVVERFGGERDVELGGQVVADYEIDEGVGSGLATAELLAFPFLLVLSLIFFRGRATLLPLAVGVMTVLGSFVVMRLINEAYGLGIFALNLVVGLGLGLAIDYSLFLITRYRQELEKRGPGVDAIRATMSSAGRTVVFSAATVAVAMATLIVFPLGFLKSMGIAGATVAVVAAVAALTIAPAFMGLWGSKLAVKKRRPRGENAGAWYRVSQVVTKRPGIVAAGAVIVMLAVASPSLNTNFTPVDSSVIPSGTSSKVVTEELAKFPGQDTDSMTVAYTAPASDKAAVTRYAAGLEGLPGVETVVPPKNLNADTWQIDLVIAGNAASSQAQDLVRQIRDRSGDEVRVGGAAAEFVDQQAGISSRMLLGGVLLAVLTFAILWLMTGSVVLPAMALAMNVLTVGAALGIITFVFGEGRLTSVFDYTPNGGIDGTNFLVAGAIIFAVSTDYGIFLFGRIREAHEEGKHAREAVSFGLQSVGTVIVAAAILLAIAIGAFMTSNISFLQQLGMATAVGVLLDALVVRSLLIPALMTRLGRWSWWSPAPLRRLHDRIGLSEEGPARGPDAPAEPAPAA
ncbi:MMPL family transporter [Patulibacter americanus]|uniref:MMPL family transporter n=1 Tax=Patulibacter americanus TaxID=588672 RepID=UPI0003B31A23|nr:MMPL family transporter [Patulibacter americanus]